MLEYFSSEMHEATLKKGSVGSYVVGKWVAGARPEEAIVVMEPQPVNAKDNMKLSDGEHIRDYLKTWVHFVYGVAGREDKKDADIIFFRGVDYEITQIEDRHLGNYQKIFIKKVG